MTGVQTCALPIFNISYHYSEYKDNLPEDEYLNRLYELFNDIPFVIIHYPETIYKIASKIGKVPERVVSWVYNSNTARQHRDIAFFDINLILIKSNSHIKILMINELNNE